MLSVGDFLLMLVLSWVWHLLDIDVELYQQFLFTDPNMFKITLQHSSCMPIQGISLLHSLLLFVRLTIHPVAETQKQIVFFVTHTPQETFQLKCAEYDWFPYFKVFILNIWKIWSCVNFVSSGVPSTHFHVPSVSVSVSPIPGDPSVVLWNSLYRYKYQHNCEMWQI